MRKQTVLATYLALVFSSLVGIAHAADGSFADQFLGSPLLVLVAVLIIDLVAFVFHKVRK